jgi:DNA-binding NarL/FixJ family response regulator
LALHPNGEVASVGADPVRVLVLYSHPLMGEGLLRMLNEVDGLEVVAVSVDQPDGLEDALAADPAVILIEEGGGLNARDLLARTDCPVVIEVDIGSAEAFSYRRDAIRSRPEEVVAAIVSSGRARVRTAPVAH